MRKQMKMITESIIVLLFTLGMAYSIYAYTPSFSLKNDIYIYELGEKLSNDPKDYVDYNLYKNGVTVTIPDNVKKVGKYKGFVKYRTFSYPITIQVTDTTKPEFVNLPKEIHLIEGNSKKNLPEFQTKDFSKVTVSIDDKNIKYDKEGQYKITVIAEDTSKNKNSITIPVIVQSKPKTITKNNKKESADNLVKNKEQVNNQLTHNINNDSQINQQQNSPSQNITQNSKPNPPKPNPSVETVDYNAIRIPNVTNLAAVSIGSSQEAVDAYDICLMSDIGSVPGNGQPILLGGHNYRTLGSLPSVPVGGVITLKYNGQIYNYRITTSAECRTNGSDMTSTATGEDLLEIGTGREVLQIYTCYYTGNFRWFVKAERI